MDFRILGSVEVSSGGLTLELSGPRQRALLAYLLLHANEVVSAERLLDELWSELPQGGVGALQTQVSRLRRVVGDRLQTVGSGYCVRVEPGELDFERFRSLLAEAGAATDAAERTRLLEDAEALWRSEPLAGLDVPFAAAERAALEELRLGATEERLAAALERGSDAELVAELSSLVARYPLRERLRANLILALYRSDRQVEALDAYRATRRMLDEELGLEPSPKLRELERAILRHDPALARVAPAPMAPPAPRRRRVPYVIAAVLALGLAAAAGAILAEDEGGVSRAQAKQPARAVTVAFSRPVHGAATHHARIQARRHATPTQPVKHKVSRTTATPAATPPTPPIQQTNTANATLVATKEKKTTTAKTTVPPPRKPSAPSPKPVTISDTFDSDIVDPMIWHQITGANLSIAETGGQLVVTIGPDAVRTGTYGQIDVHAGTQCRFPGNFDAQVDFTLLEWPAGDNIVADLNAIYIGATVGRENSSQAGDIYDGWVGPNSFNSVPLADVSGSLRITRINGIATTYMLHRGAWVKLGAGPAPGSAIFGLGANSMDSTSEFGHQELKVAFDNFKVTAVDPLCPPGSEPGK